LNAWDSVIVVDWSAGNDRGPTPKRDAIWIGAMLSGVEQEPVYLRNRHVAEDHLSDLILREKALGRRVLVGFDFPFGYPVGFAERVIGRADPLALWDWFAENLRDAPGANNRFELAGRLNGTFPGIGPFWFNGTRQEIAGLPRKGTAREGHGMPERRAAEVAAKGAFSLWQMGGAGSVGGQAMTGMAALSRLRRRFADAVSVWPFEPLDREIAFVEVWPSLISDRVSAEKDDIKDRAQVRCLARAIARLPGDDLSAMLAAGCPEEGWIFGLGYEEALAMATEKNGELVPPRLKNDCFALPPGVDWTPVDEALDRLKERLHPVVGSETRLLDRSGGLVLSVDATARRSNPPAPNSAVDGYGFDHAATGDGDQILQLVSGRAAAGAPFEGEVPFGQALRILTGAILPKGVDTVVLEEDCSTDGGRVAFEGPVRKGSNTRKAGEDVLAGQVAVTAGSRLGPSEMALLSATGVTEVSVFRPLCVGVLSTGDEIVASGTTPDPARTYDANRPMLLELVRDWRMTPLDLGHVADNRDALRAVLDEAAKRCDAILTSGGASAGDEDHVSALLGEAGSRADWRIALKPGRPLVLGMWRGVPVFGLPGNPVAALVCTMIFARPALGLLGGEGWTRPTGFDVPAAFEKTKKPGRREYLRARLNSEGCAEVFRSEGSGRISGLAWADGLVEIGDGARRIEPGDVVRYIPYASFR
jgi:molybdopterin molybdotransferase